MFLRTPQVIRPVMVWYDFKGQKPLILVHKIKKQAFRLGETPFFCVVDYLPKIPVDICWFFSLTGKKKKVLLTPQAHMNVNTWTHEWKVPENLQ